MRCHLPISTITIQNNCLTLSLLYSTLPLTPTLWQPLIPSSIPTFSCFPEHRINGISQHVGFWVWLPGISKIHQWLCESNGAHSFIVEKCDAVAHTIRTCLHSPAEGRSGCFQFGAIMNTAAINIRTWILLSKYLGVRRLSGNSVCDCMKNWQTRRSCCGSAS